MIISTKDIEITATTRGIVKLDWSMTFDFAHVVLWAFFSSINLRRLLLLLLWLLLLILISFITAIVVVVILVVIIVIVVALSLLRISIIVIGFVLYTRWLLLLTQTTVWLLLIRRLVRITGWLSLFVLVTTSFIPSYAPLASTSWCVMNFNTGFISFVILVLSWLHINLFQ